MTSSRPPGIRTDGAPDAGALGDGWVPITPGDLPAEPFDLTSRSFVVATVVRSDEDAATVLLAAARGCAVVVQVALPGDDGDAFLDDLSRLVDLRSPPGQVSLDDHQRALLDLLADGSTVTDAARRLGWSRRSATRRLSDARRRLGAATTAEALRRFRGRPLR